MTAVYWSETMLDNICPCQPVGAVRLNTLVSAGLDFMVVLFGSSAF